MTTLDPALEKLLDSLKQFHHYCEDRWYSCPLSADGCLDDRQEGCNCGASEHNETLEKLRALLSGKRLVNAKDCRFAFDRKDRRTSVTLDVGICTRCGRETTVEEDVDWPVYACASPTTPEQDNDPRP